MLGIPFLDDAVGKLFKPQTFDDPVDRLNYFVTASILAFFALMVSAKQYVGQPISCWTPQEFKGNWEEFAEDLCFIKNTYYVSPEDEIPLDQADRDQRQFGYYQWVPVMLAIQAFMFFLPNWLWQTLHQQSGIDLSTAVSDARKLRSMSAQDRAGEVDRLSNYVAECLELHSPHPTPRRILFVRFGQSLGSYVSMLYLVTKLLYVANVFGQFVLLNNFIGGSYSLWGWTALSSVWTQQEWRDAPIFPRVSICDFHVRRLANIHRYSVQCVLMINLFNEKIFLFIWFWLVFVAISTIINFFYCVATLLPARARQHTLFGLLNSHDMRELIREPETRAFVEDFAIHGLRPDGVLLLRFVEGHAGAIVARDLCTKLFKSYLEGRPEYTAVEKHHARLPGSHSTKSTSPGGDEQFGGGHDGTLHGDSIHPPHYEKQALMEPDSHSTFSIKPKFV